MYQIIHGIVFGMLCAFKRKRKSLWNIRGYPAGNASESVVASRRYLTGVDGAEKALGFAVCQIRFDSQRTGFFGGIIEHPDIRGQLVSGQITVPGSAH